jgi:hypothetical protein
MYWTLEEYKQTREKINPVSKWWGKSRKDKRPKLLSYIDDMVRFLVKESENIADFDLGFDNL